MSMRDYTLLSKLGFSDPDKKNPVHDTACRYIAETNQSELLWQKTDLLYNSGDKYSFGKALVEEPISKGSGQYKTTIGFIDVLLVSAHTEINRVNGARFPAVGIGVEVKITQQSLHDTIRQIKLYMEYTKYPVEAIRDRAYVVGTFVKNWYLAAVFDITEQDKNTLEGNGIKFIRLGRSFESYLAAQKESVVYVSDLVL